MSARLMLVASLALSLSATKAIAAARLTNSAAANGRITLTWNGRGTLETAAALSGQWHALSNAASPYTAALTGSPAFFRLNQTVDSSTLHRKVLCGYQGWFRCPGDGGSQWVHWSRSGSTIVSNTLTFEMWPDMSEYTNRYAAGSFTYPGGGQAYLFSSRDQQTVDRHFDWMQEFGIDGVFLSRFVTGVSSRPTNVLVNVQRAANRTGRTFALMYDMTGQSTNTLFSRMTDDWRWLNDNLHLTQDPRYLHHNGKPVLLVWGFFADRFSTNLAHQIIDYFKTNPVYGVTLVGGGEWWWRTESAPGWPQVFRRFDVYSPWNVGNVSVSGSTRYASTAYWTADLAAASSAGMLYLPVIYPGFSWNNLQQLPAGTSTIPRLGGNFLWKQFNAAANLGLDMAFVAMFDEVDEGTAIFKVSNTPPTQANFVTYEGLPANWYLRLTAEGTKVLAGERPNTATIPISP
ncbi:MAG TPA: glycoside hydrolase family 71/99-like protein [Verrucomicrobiae bacterium]